MHNSDLAKIQAAEIIFLVAADILGEAPPASSSGLTLSDISAEDRKEAGRLVRPMIKQISQTKRDWAFDSAGRGLISVLGGLLGGGLGELTGGAAKSAGGLNDLSATRATAQEVHSLYLDMVMGRPLTLNGRSLARETWGQYVR